MRDYKKIEGCKKFHELYMDIKKNVDAVNKMISEVGAILIAFIKFLRKNHSSHTLNIKPHSLL